MTCGTTVPGVDPAGVDPPGEQPPGVDPDPGRIWRRGGEALFAALTLAIVAAEAGALGVLVWVLLFGHTTPSAGEPLLDDVLVAAISTTALLVAAVTVVMVFLGATGARRDEAETASKARWLATWRAVMEGNRPCPTGNLGRAAIDALLDLRESATGPEAGLAQAVVESSGTDRVLMGRLEGIVADSRRSTLLRALRLPPLFRPRPTAASALDTLEDLARARLAESVPLLTALVANGTGARRRQALRAAARSIAVIEDPTAQAAAAVTLLQSLSHRGVPRGELDEALMLLDQAAPAAARAVTARYGASPPEEASFGATLLAASLDAAGRLGSTAVADLLAPQLRDDRPLEVRAAALRALAAQPSLPPGTEQVLRRALSDPQDVVRTQAAKAVRLFPDGDAARALSALLADPSWWVRLAAGQTLAILGPVGKAALADAALHDRDRYARQMAAQALRDAGLGYGTGGRTDVGVASRQVPA